MTNNVDKTFDIIINNNVDTIFDIIKLKLICQNNSIYLSMNCINGINLPRSTLNALKRWNLGMVYSFTFILHKL